MEFVGNILNPSNRKKILVINPISLFPAVGMSQIRTINMIKRLSEDYIVDVSTFCGNEEQLNKSRINIKDICNNFFPITPVNPKNNLLKRKYYGLKYLLLYYIIGIPTEYSYYGNNKSIQKFLKIINRYKYDIVIIGYWYQGRILEELDSSIFKVIDTHYFVQENKKLHSTNKYDKKILFFKTHELKKSEKLQNRFFKSANLIVSNSQKGKDILSELHIHNSCLVIPNGQNIEYFKGYENNLSEDTILFYGSMGSNQNKKAFYRFWYKILPFIKKEISDINILIVGSSPPDSIKKLDNEKDVVVTGYVKDIREYLSRAYLMILPLEIGSGFRGRVIEVMAMGIPVIGTHNALDSIEMIDGVHGYICDDDEEMAEYAIKLLKDNNLRRTISNNCKKFVSKKYSIESTFGKLSKYFLKLENN